MSEQADCTSGPEDILWLTVESFSKQDFSVESSGGLENHAVMEQRLMEQLIQGSDQHGAGSLGTFSERCLTVLQTLAEKGPIKSFL